ncbi:MAG TPA: SgcJ/EcaC family oxidoreductase [Prolixibacteraceae bacterium]|nr:SgcJ/EcaC family oxidoreductase [Prolixibacteraceae bacterium]
MNKKNDSGTNPTREAIQARTRIFEQAMANADAAGVANCYTEDAEFMAPNEESVKGKSNIQTTIAGYISQGFTQYKVADSIVYGSVGVVGVQTEYSLSQKDGKNSDSGKSIQLWKQENGEWKIFRDCFNSNLPDNS